MLTVTEYIAYARLREYYIERKRPIKPALVNGPFPPFEYVNMMQLGANNPHLLRLMLALGGNVNAVGLERRRTLEHVLSLKTPSMESIKIILNNGAKTEDAWHVAAHHGHKDVLIYLAYQNLMPYPLFSNTPVNIQMLLWTQIVMVALCTPLAVRRFHKSIWLTLDCLRLLYTYL
jgi:hypothetical protein